MASRPVTLNLGGHERTLRLTLWAVGEVGDRLGITVRLNTLQDDLLAVPLPLRTLPLLLWAALVHEDESLTVEQVGKWVDQDNAAEVLAGFFSLFGGASQEKIRQKIEENMGIEAATAA